MAFRPFLCLTLLWTTFGAFAGAASSPTVPAEVLNFVPPCAQECFQSFIVANFDFKTCGNSPSLACLCSQTGSLGYTVGEGAVSCMIAEKSIGRCQGADGTPPRTHATILATLVVPSGTGPLLVPTPTPTTSATKASTSATRTTSSPGTTTSTATLDPESSTASSAGSSTSSTTTAPPPPPPASTGSLDQAAATSSRPALTSPQIAGIVLGVAAIVVFAIFIAPAIGRPAPAFGALAGSPRTSSPTVGRTNGPRMVQRVGSAMAMATAPPPHLQTPQRTVPSPPKPMLTIDIPKAAGKMTQASTNRRDSIVTEFAEDGEGESASGTAVWRPPPTDPQSATAYYFADKGGNWVLRNTSTRKPEANNTPPMLAAPGIPQLELPSPEDKTKAERAREAFAELSPDAAVSPLRLPQKPGQGKLGSPIVFRDRQGPRMASPKTSNGVGQPASASPRNIVPAKQAVPDNYFTTVRGARELASSKSRRKSRRTSRRRSQDSATSIDSAPSGPFEDDDIIDDDSQGELSPVAESPIPPGRPPVQYPTISGRGNVQNANGFLQPPRYPSLRSGSPETRLGNIPAIEQQRGPQQRQQEAKYTSRYWGQQQPPPQAQQQRRPYPPAQHPGARPTQQGYYTTPPQQEWRPPHPQSRQAAHVADNIAQSSLLAKRLGADKAAALQLGGQDAALKKNKTGWARESLGPQGLAPPASMRPGYAPPAAAGPASPAFGWRPELTPTRRGDDLFLNVR
ncbi:hypothetical protein B0T26DRAFT_673152 [Lasiosphaeria miniovina]|uniref:Extracellular membrane protein CFEM domain-containing protein n=1 Tax=Lasiosphaeria miniovina TaxID=1954250 RepID=A0AA40EAU0_9PEZI|nr:uncharacterized protein B0T26DRAFT_673152 [Lasiosphaeria miniovina]KAK0728658.1 hypothetical protein B0T26DRAFT_673152 [Lasiosphaeria miniovina]